MGDHFYINQFTFKSELPEEILELAYHRYASKHMEYYYRFTYQGSGGGKLHKYTLWMRDNETKCDVDVKSLAKFVSTVIAPNTHTLIEVETGGNEMWGYLVVPGDTYDLTYTVKKTVNGIPLEEFLKQRIGDLNYIKTIRSDIIPNGELFMLTNPGVAAESPDLSIKLGTRKVVKGKAWLCPNCNNANTEVVEKTNVECKRCGSKFIIPSPIDKNPKPMPGDFVIVTKSSDLQVPPGTHGMIEEEIGQYKDEYSVRFNPSTCPFMDDRHAIPSGVPVYCIPSDRLISTGKKDIKFEVELPIL